jgi:tetratricopeptide (TPR) repeat protein
LHHQFLGGWKMFSMSANKSLALLALVALVSRGRVARCQEPSGDAERIFQEGRAALAEENYEVARSHFERSYKLDSALGTLLNLAVCEEKVGKLRAALLHLQEALEKAGQDDRRRPLIAQRLARLESRVPRLIVRPSSPLQPGVNLSLDAVVLSVADIGKTLRVDPGTHVLDCAGSRGERCTTVFTLEEGQESVQAPTVSAPAAVPAVLPSPGWHSPQGTSPGRMAPASKAQAGADRRSLAYAAGGFGLASIAVGLIAGASVLHQKAIVDAHCDGSGCDEEGLAAAEKGTTMSAVSTVATGLGVVIMGASVYLLVSAPSARGPAAGLSFAGSF